MSLTYPGRRQAGLVHRRMQCAFQGLASTLTIPGISMDDLDIASPASKWVALLGKAKGTTPGPQDHAQTVNDMLEQLELLAQVGPHLMLQYIV